MNAAASVSTCSTFPLHSVTSVQETKQNKETSGRNGSPFDFLCRCGRRAEGWACERERVRVCERLSPSCMCVSVYMSCQVVLVVCVCERERECERVY